MGIVLQFPNVYQTTSTAPFSNSTNAVTSCGGATLASFGFPASYVRLENLGSVDLWADFKSTVGSTMGFRLGTCAQGKVWEYFGKKSIPIAQVALWATSTAAVANVTAIG